MTSLVLSILNGSSSYLQIRTTIKACMSLNFVKIPLPIMELAALERLKLIDNVVTTLAAPSFLIGSSFLQVPRTTIKSRMGLKFGQIRPWTVELATLERLEKSP